MEGNGTFLPQFLNLLNGATEIVNPLNMYRALFREHLNVMNFNDLMTQYQGVELYLGQHYLLIYFLKINFPNQKAQILPLDAFENSPTITGPGNPFFNFLKPTICEYSITSGCVDCGIADNETNRQEYQIPYFFLQMNEIPAGATLSDSFSAKFAGISKFLK